MQEFAVEAVKQELGISNNTKGFGFLCIYPAFLPIWCLSVMKVP